MGAHQSLSDPTALPTVPCLAAPLATPVCHPHHSHPRLQMSTTAEPGAVCGRAFAYLFLFSFVSFTNISYVKNGMFVTPDCYKT